MKKILSIVVIIAVPGILITKWANAQGSLIKDGGKPVFSIPLASRNTKSSFERALKDFRRSFKDIDNVRWEKVEDGNIAIFTSKGIKNTVAYNTKGYWHHTIRQYGEENLPAEVRTLVRSNYFDFSISQVEELSISGATIYLVHLDTINEHKLLRISEEKMEVIVNATASN